MRRKISLYINNRLVDLDDQNLILFNYTMDDLTNPAIVKNSYSQQVTLPATANNNKIFGDYFRLDRVTEPGAFNSLEKTPFVIYDEMDNILESGYVKLDKVSKGNNGISSYSVSLFGGLGGFFYNLMYNEDGTKKSLADIYYYVEDEARSIFPPTEQMTINRNVVKAAWDTLGEEDYEGFYSIINFAPAYNGIPSNYFDANRAVYKPGNGTNICPNLYTSADGYSAKSDANGTILLEMDNKHDEWEMQDLRSYLQRPVISLRSLFAAFCDSLNTGDYAFRLDDSFFNSDNGWYWKGWMTLPLIDRSKFDPANFSMADLLKGTDSPADYLIGFAKMFGLVFIIDSATNTIVLTSRNQTFDDEDIIDLTKRMDTSAEISPNAMDAKFYLWKSETFGEFATDYESKYGKAYGEQRVNTGYDFNADATNLLDGVVFKGAADVTETSALFQVFGGNSDSLGSYTNHLFKVPFVEGVKWKLYQQSGGQENTKDFEPLEGWLAPLHYSRDNSYRDFLPKVQLHGADGKPENGNNVLLFYNGKVETPKEIRGGIVILDAIFHLSDDTDAMLLLNGGHPCWDASPIGNNLLQVDSIPSFRRWEQESADEFGNSFDFGYPLEVATEGLPLEDGTIYHNFWKKYIEDKFNLDTKVVRKKVDLSGMQVNFNLLRKFYWFDNSVWVMNKIINHSLTTWDLTECEFIQVRDTDNYQYGQISFL